MVASMTTTCPNPVSLGLLAFFLSIAQSDLGIRLQGCPLLRKVRVVLYASE